MNPCKLQLPPIRALRTPPDPGWITVSERIYRLNRVGRADPCSLASETIRQPVGWLDWLKPLTPVAIIGETIRLYHVSEKDLPVRAARPRHLSRRSFTATHVLARMRSGTRAAEMR